jgi:hypothetical protein
VKVAGGGVRRWHCWSNAFPGLVRSSAVPNSGKTHYEFTEEVMLANSFSSAAKFFSFSITLHICKLYKSACVWNTRGLLWYYVFAAEERAPTLSNFVSAKTRTHAEPDGKLIWHEIEMHLTILLSSSWKQSNDFSVHKETKVFALIIPTENK